MSSFLAALLVSGAVSAVTTALLARLAPRLSWGDAPDLPRKHQAAPVPPVGGAAVLCGFGAAALLFGFEAPFGLPGGAVAATLVGAFLVGTVDDLRPGGLGPRSKLLLQAACGLPLALAAAGRLADGPTGAVLAGLGALVAVLAALNLANTFDHADGALGSIALPGLLVASGGAAAGAVAGFLPRNLDAERGRRGAAPTAYLGDAGSHLVGVLLLVHPLAWPVFLLPALDLLRLAVVRTREGSRPWIGDRRHVSHLLAARGLAPREVALRLFLASAPACLGALLPSAGALPWLVGLAASALLYAWLHRGARPPAPAPVR